MLNWILGSSCIGTLFARGGYGPENRTTLVELLLGWAVPAALGAAAALVLMSIMIVGDRLIQGRFDWVQVRTLASVMVVNPGDTKMVVRRTLFVLPYIFAFVILVSVSSGDDTERWTPELMMKHKSVTQVRVSPDGKRAAFVVSEAQMQGEKSENLAHIHVANSDGSDEFQLTFGDKSCSNPQWSPDSGSIAFTSARSGKNNVWLIRVRGGEAQMITDVRTSVGSFAWAPEGKRFAFTAVDEETPQEEKGAKEKNDARVVDENVKMSRLFVINIEKTPQPSPPPQGGREPKLNAPSPPVGEGRAGGTSNGTQSKTGVSEREIRKLTSGSFTVVTYDWSPDGKNIVFAHTRTLKADDWTTSDLSLVEVETATVKPLVATAAAESSPQYSPDGKWIAYIASDSPPTWADNETVWVIPATPPLDPPPNGGRARELKETFDRNPTIVGWSADGKRVFFTEVRGTRRRLYALPMEGAPVEISSGEGSLGFQVDLNRTRTMFGLTIESSRQAREGFVSAVGAFAPMRISHANKDFPSLALGRTEVLRWKSTDGMEIEGLLTYPIDYVSSKRCPLLLIIHGGPAGVFTENFTAAPSLYPIAAFASRGYAVLRCNPRGSSGYGKKFRYANYRDWGGGDYRDLMAGVDHIVRMGVADADRLGVMGWSYGGYMTSWIITQTRRFKAASVGAGVTNLVSFTGTADIPGFLPDYFGGEPWDQLDAYRAHSAMFNVKGVMTPTLIQHGERDERVPITQGYELYNALKRQGCTVKMVVYPRTPHGPTEPKLMKDIMTRNLEWFDRYVKGVTE